MKTETDFDYDTRRAGTRPVIWPTEFFHRGVHRNGDGVEIWACAHKHREQEDAQVCADRVAKRIAKGDA